MNDATPVGYVLIADDDQDDIEMLTAALREADSNMRVVEARNGKLVLAQLKKTPLAPGEVLPCVLVMDINMPQMDGRETVVAIKTDDRLKNLPILLFSTAKNRTDALFAEKWNVRYFQKPDTVQGLNEIAQEVLAMCQEKV